MALGERAPAFTAQAGLLAPPGATRVGAFKAPVSPNGPAAPGALQAQSGSPLPHATQTWRPLVGADQVAAAELTSFAGAQVGRAASSAPPVRPKSDNRACCCCLTSAAAAVAAAVAAANQSRRCLFGLIRLKSRLSGLDGAEMRQSCAGCLGG